MKRETRDFLKRGILFSPLVKMPWLTLSLPVSTPLAPTPSCSVFPSDQGHLAHQVGCFQGLSMFSLGYGPQLLQVLPSIGPEFCPQDPSLDRLGPIHMKRIFVRISQHGWSTQVDTGLLWTSLPKKNPKEWRRDVPSHLGRGWSQFRLVPC